MDGLLIDSEDLYTVCTNAVLHKYNKPSLPWNIKAQLQGRPAASAGAIFEQWAQLPVSRDVYVKEVQALQREQFPKCQPLPGVEMLLRRLRAARGRCEMALATSSQEGNYRLKTERLTELFALFDEENRVLGDDPRIPPGRGKPAPDIYLLALETINERIRREGGKVIRPDECLVFEDSVPGVEAGRRAGMQVVWCPHPGLLGEMKGKEELVLAGLTGEHKEISGGGGKAAVPGAVGDGWARLFSTLEDFPFADYGIHVGA